MASDIVKIRIIKTLDDYGNIVPIKDAIELEQAVQVLMGELADTEWFTDPGFWTVIVQEDD